MKMIARAALAVLMLCALQPATAAPKVNAPAANGTTVPSSAVGFGAIGTDYTSVTAATPLPVDVQGKAASGATASGNPNLVGGADSTNKVRTVCTDTIGTFCAPQAGATQIVETFTNASATTSTTVCPAVTNPVSVEIQVAAAGALGLRGQTLTSATYATGAGSPSVVVAAGALYTAPVGISNAITYYGAAGVVICRQIVRQ